MNVSERGSVFVFMLEGGREKYSNLVRLSKDKISVNVYRQRIDFSNVPARLGFLFPFFT
jgi:hypothetical protein